MKTITMFLDNESQPHATEALAAERNAQIKRVASKAAFIAMIGEKFKDLNDPCGSHHRDEANRDVRAGRSEAVHIFLENPDEMIAALNTYKEAIA